MNPRRAKQVINTFSSLSGSNYCAIFHLYNVQFSTSLGVSSATCVRTLLRLPTIFYVLLSPPQGEAFDSDENAYSRYVYLKPDFKEQKATLVNIDSPKELVNIPFSKILPAQDEAYNQPALGFHFQAIGKMWSKMGD